MEELDARGPVNCTSQVLRYYRAMQLRHLGNDSDLHDNLTLPAVNWTSRELWELQLACEDSRLRVGVQAASLAVIIFCSLLANLLVLVVFYQRPSLLTISNRFVLNLAVSNLLITILVMPFVFASTIMGPSWSVSRVGCDIVATATTILFATCIFTLLLISVDRLYAIKRPLHYSMKITRLRSTIYIASVWVVSFAVALPPLLSPGGISYQPDKGLCTTNWLLRTPQLRVYTYCMVGVCFVLPFAVMIWIYVTIFRAVQRTSAMARRNSVTPDANDVTVTQQMLVPPPTANSRRRSSLVSLTLMQLGSLARRQSSSAMSRTSFHREDWRAAKTGLIVMSTFTLCWLPIFIVMTLEASLPTPAHMDSPIPQSLQAVSVWLALLVCALNPMVYVFRTKAFKHELFALLGRPPLINSGIVLLREPTGTPTASCNGRISKTASAATFTRIITPRPSAISVTDIDEARAALTAGLTMKDLTAMDKQDSPSMVAKIRSSVPL